MKSYVRNGRVADKVHERVSFKKSKWLERYISFNTQKRKLAENNFQRDFDKLLNNSFYRKTVEIVRKTVKIRFF